MAAAVEPITSAALASCPHYTEYVGDYGTGNFTQSGGTNAISGNLYFGYGAASCGTYNLNGGTVILSGISAQRDTAVFNFGGGTLQANASFMTTLPMTLTGSGGNATVDTAGYALPLRVALWTGGLTKNLSQK